MPRITEDMTFEQIEALPGLERAAGYLMECRPESRERNGQMSVAALRQVPDDVAADRMLAGLRRLDEVACKLGRPDVELWSTEEMTLDPTRERTRLFRFPGKPGAPFVLVIPGGGYCCVCSALEGFPLAAELSAAGYNAFVLSYRTREAAKMPAPIEDAAHALQLILRDADALGVGRHYALAGFSAGAHLAGELCTDNWGWEAWGLPRPEALVLNYPAVATHLLAEQPEENQIIAQMMQAMFGPSPSEGEIEAYDVVAHVSPGCPPTYLWQAEDDATVPIESSRSMAARLAKLGVEHEYQTYPHGDHGLTAPHEPDADLWPERVVAFLRQRLPIA